MIDKEKYVAKIANASPLELIIINFDIILDYLEYSRKNINTDTKNFDISIKKARKALLELKLGLELDNEIGKELYALYNYADKKIADYLFTKDTNELDEAIKILIKLKNSFEAILHLEKDKSKVMKNTETLYSGLTYDKNAKPIEYRDNNNRGFKA